MAREAKIKSGQENHIALEGVVENGSMQTSGHHQYYIEQGKLGNDLDEIATATSEYTKKDFVEMYQRKRKEHYGVQAHDENADGRIIKNLFRRAYAKSGIKGGGYEGTTPKYSK